MGYTYNFFRKFYHSTPNWGITEHAFGRFVKLRTGIETSAKSLKVLQKMERKATNAARWIIFPTKSGMDQLLKDMRIAKASHKWHVVPHVVEIEKFDKAIARKRLGISMDDKILVAIGSLIPMKRFDLLFKAIAQIPLVTLQKIIILGDGTEKAALIHLAKELNIQQRINITTTENVGEYLSAADIYVSTSSTESFGIANCEAILAGVPSVVTAVDAVPEVVGDAAILVGDSPMDIAIAIKKVLESEELQTELKSKSEKHVRSWYKRDKLSDIMIDIYQNS
jgi:glycosyltransferase involved in cell wall biosynthesis